MNLNLDKPFSPACERNKGPILELLLQYFGPDVRSVLEVGSGTGQHAVHFAAQMPHLTWQTSDLRENLLGIRTWITDSGLTNIAHPIELDVTENWPERMFDAVYSANTAHIMAWPEVQCFIKGAGRSLRDGGCFALYGPFKIKGSFTSESNRQFDASLRMTVPHRGVRDLESIQREAVASHMEFRAIHAMPANNFLLIFVKLGTTTKKS